MNVLGHGLDLVDATRYAKLFESGRDKHLNRYFTANELSSVPNDPNLYDRLASRFAAKEAVMKALRHGFGDGLAFTDIEIQIDESGAPSPILHGKAKRLAEDMGIRQWWISLSHTGNVAAASAIACG